MSALLITGLRLFKEHVLTPRGRDMIPELGPVVTVSPGSKLSYLGAGGNVIFKLVRKERGSQGDESCRNGLSNGARVDGFNIYIYSARL
jgi:hypothetical protein